MTSDESFHDPSAFQDQTKSNPARAPQGGLPAKIAELSSGPTGGLLSPRNQLDFDREFFGRILARNADDVDSLRRLVEIHARCGNHTEALQLDRRLVRLRPRDAIAHYNLACSLSILRHREHALEALDKALELGYRDLAHMESDPDLERLRQDEAYAALLDKHGLLR